MKRPKSTSTSLSRSAPKRFGARAGGQYKLFETEATLENGLWYRPDFITPDEEEALLVWIGALDMRIAKSGPQEARPGSGDQTFYKAKRRHAGFGWGYDFARERFVPGPPLPPFLGRFARRIEKWLDLGRGRVVEALVNEYQPGTGLGWHKDKEPFRHIVGLSLGGWVTMRFRPYASPKEAVGIELEPRSIYVMQGAVRDDWQHSVAPARTLRYSVTFRTLPELYAKEGRTLPARYRTPQR